MTPRIDQSRRFPRVREDGSKQCVWCGTSPLPKSRSSWCSDACVQEYELRAMPARVRRRVHARDKGVCALCRIDCDAIARSLSPPQSWYPINQKRARGVRLLERLWGVRLTGRRTFWDMDHTLPLVEGGANALANLRTLCRKCHKRETAALARRRACKSAPTC